MTDIPKDIWEKAMHIAAADKDLAAIRIGIMQALVDERERCAKICRNWDNGDIIAEEIQSGEQP